MLFNSYPFLFVFLPLALLIFYGLRRAGRPELCVPFLMLASLAFYSYWKVSDLWVLLTTIVWNFTFASYLARRSTQSAKLLLAVAVAGDLAFLAYFKYFNFIVGSIAQALHLHYAARHIDLPIGISFFTFTQIAYVVDCYRSREHEKRFVNYGLFVTVFPHLIAGPIIHHAQMRPQFERIMRERIDPRMVALGVPVLVLGLAKKVLLADNLAALADPVFAAADQGAVLSAADGWLGIVAYTLQIYFDFSGYSDMAIGLGLMFGLRFPVNFNSPYKSLSIIEFWRRWHITLSTWLRDYLYISLGGNRGGEFRRLRNVGITMLLGGIWHGAGWTFVIWGALHAVYIVINHVAHKVWPPQDSSPWALKLGKWLLTLALVMFAWVFFRAKSVPAALAVLEAIFSGHGAAHSLRALDVVDYFWLLLGTGLALFAANTQQICGYSAKPDAPLENPAFAFRNLRMPAVSPVSAVVLGVLSAAVLASLWKPAIFIYFNF